MFKNKLYFLKIATFLLVYLSAIEHKHLYKELIVFHSEISLALKIIKLNLKFTDSDKL